MIKVLKLKRNEEKVEVSSREERKRLTWVRNHLFAKFVEEGREKVMMVLISKFHRLRFEDIEEIYNDGCMVMWSKMNEKEFSLKKECLMSYLMTVCKNIGTHYLRKVRDEVISYDEMMERIDTNEEEGIERVFDVIDDGKMEMDVKYEKLDEVWGKLSDIDKMILESYYWEGEKMNEIAKKIGYKNGDSVKSKKSKILKKMLEMMGNNAEGCNGQPSLISAHELRRCA